MPKPIDVLLYEGETADGPSQLRGALDELTLTYTIVERSHGGRTRDLRRHVPSLRDARRWAASHGESRAA